MEFKRRVIPHLSGTGRYVNICFDIGGVILRPNLDISHGTTLHPSLFKRMMRSHAWNQYLEGKLPWLQTRRKLLLVDDHATGIDETDIQTFIDNARASLTPVPEIISLIEALPSNLKLYCMTNAADEDYNFVITTFPELFQHKFEAIFHSGATGIRKPCFGAFQHFLQETKVQSSETLFIDDSVQNVVAAQVMGFTAIHVDRSASIADLVVYHLRTEAERLAAARDYLHRNKGRRSLTSDGLRVEVLYDHFLIAELLNDPTFLPLNSAPETGLFNFFPLHERRLGKASTNSVSHKNLPNDLDTTSIALLVLHKFGKVDMAVIDTVLNKMLEFVTEDGLFAIYFDPFRARTDHVVQAVICQLFLLAGRLEQVGEVHEILYKVLRSRAYMFGSMYYPAPEAFLWHMARLEMAMTKESRLLEGESGRLLEKRVSERVGLPGNATVLAMRVLACEYCGVANTRDREQLARMQKVDGSWDVSPFYNYGGGPECWIGNEITATAFAVAALHTKVDHGGFSALS